MTITCTGTYKYPLFLWKLHTYCSLFSPLTNTITPFVSLDAVCNSQFRPATLNAETFLNYYSNSITAVYTSHDTTISFEQFKSDYPEYFL